MHPHLWSTSLRRLQERFQRDAGQRRVRCILQHAGTGRKLIENQPDDVDPGGIADYSVTYGMDAVRRVWLVGESESVAAIRELATGAGRCLLGLPKGFSHVLPTESLALRDDALRWLFCLFDLAWRKVPGSPLAADKEYRLPPEMTARVFRSIIGIDPEPVDLPDAFCSNLPDGFGASVYAIDLILAASIKQKTSPASELSEELHRISPGRESATVFRQFTARLLPAIFGDEIADVAEERETDGGRSRVDLVFRNCARNGFFADLIFRHRIHCPHVFVECKNISDDPANPEFDQVCGRLNERRGMVGFIICRSVADQAAVLERSQIRWSNERKLILVLTDDDACALLALRDSRGPDGVSEYLHRMLDPILLRS